MVFKDQLNLEIRKNLLPQTTSFEHVLFTDRLNNVNYVLIYRFHAFTTNQFLVEFEEFAPAVDLPPGRQVLVFLGDFNVHYDCPWKSEVKVFTTNIASLTINSLLAQLTHYWTYPRLANC